MCSHAMIRPAVSVAIARVVYVRTERVTNDPYQPQIVRETTNNS